MKKICTLLSLILMIAVYNSEAQTTYTISSNTSWNGTYAATCANCTFNISAGKTLTIDKNINCNTCTFNGGNIVMTQDVVCQPCAFSNNNITLTNKELKPNSSTTTFSSVTLNATGSADLLANTAITISNSTFTFNNTSFFKNNGGQLSATASIFNFYDDAYFLANAGPVNLTNTSGLIAGNGSISSNAYIKMNGPTLNIYDNSYVAVKNKNNSYFNWGSFNSASTGSSFSTASNSLNCGGTNPHACSSPSVFGCATLSATGASACSILPVSLNEFTAEYVSNEIELSWSTSEEINFDHFTIQRSDDGNNFESIGTVYSTNSSIGNTYHFSDASLLSNTNYYRLQIADKDGKISYSKIVSVDAGTVASLVSIYPNPVTNLTFTVRLSSVESTVINVFTMDGRLLFMTSFEGQTQYQIKLPASASKTSNLIVQVISKGETNTFNILNRNN